MDDPEGLPALSVQTGVRASGVQRKDCRHSKQLRRPCEQMSGVAIVNQIMFIYFLCLFGGMSGAGIFTAQYYGYKDNRGIQYTFRYKLWMGFIITAVAVLVMLGFGSDLVGLFLNESSSGGDLQATLNYALGYMRIIFFSMPLVFVSFTYSSTLRECGETVVP